MRQVQKKHIRIKINNYLGQKHILLTNSVTITIESHYAIESHHAINANYMNVNIIQ